MEDSVEEQTVNEPENDEISKVFETLSDKQKDAVYAIIGQALEDAGVDFNDNE